MKKYADWIRSLPCSVCQDDITVVQHHAIDLEGVTKGMSLKTPEVFSMPLCDAHHQMLHQDLVHWESVYGSQLSHILKTQLLAMLAGWEMTHE
jgi:hypothetical protein